MFKQRMFYLIVAAALLAGCGDTSDHGGVIMFGDNHVGSTHFTFDHGDVVLHPEGEPDARITSAGDFSIDGKPVTVDAAERAQLQHYYIGVMNVREHGIATGKLGAKLATHAIGSVIRNLAQGNPDKIDQEVNPQADQVEQSAMKICDDLTGIKAAQDALAAQLAAFKPYAGILGSKDESDCRDHHDNLADSPGAHPGSTLAGDVKLDDFAGKWGAPGVPGGAMDVTTTAIAPQLRLVLPESMRVSGGNVFLLQRESTDTYAVDDNGIRIAFALASPGHAELSIKGHNDHGAVDLDSTLVRE